MTSINVDIGVVSEAIRGLLETQASAAAIEDCAVVIQVFPTILMTFFLLTYPRNYWTV